jgi:cbb3-type cytochrome c oxidase subunit III
MRLVVGLLFALASFVVLPGFILSAQSQTPDGRTIWSGVYSDPQAARGQAEYGSHCANCHRDDLSGYQNILKGDRFMAEYREASLYRLFDKMKTTMPRNEAGSLSDDTYVDILSYVLKANEFPAGGDDLKLEDLARILVVGQGGPEPVPNFSLVQVTGCLTLNETDNTWLVTNATDPVRATHPQASPEELAASAGQPLGAGTLQLLLSAAHVPDPHKGHKVDARGFLMRRPSGNRINVTSLETVSPDCGW